MSGIEALITAAAAARDNAYAPYSRFKVGAAIRAADGRIFVGANVENASYPAGLCAEAAALAAMIAAGARRVAELAIVAESAAPVPPCGLCRQRLAEFAGPEAAVHLAHYRRAAADGAARRASAARLRRRPLAALSLRWRRAARQCRCGCSRGSRCRRSRPGHRHARDAANRACSRRRGARRSAAGRPRLEFATTTVSGPSALLSVV